jgi:ubiquinol-cytochrome c reductase cytochrome c subunit
VRSLAARRHRLAPVAVLVLGLLLTGAVYSFVAPDRAQATAQTSGPTGSVEEGKKLFLANCATCHGKDAQGASDGPSLIGVGSAAVHFQVETGRMPLKQPGPQAPRGRRLFNDQQAAHLGAYIASLAPGPSVPTAEQLDYEKGNAASGGEIFRTNCSMCHNFAGRAAR